ncbi:MAG: hypothetical protein QG597_4803 [Actinomycetota bacterium]|jgi:hypothetical protein|nr:hypothetical protein [Actinomycetota bacterium]
MRARRYTAPATPTQADRRRQWGRYLATRAWHRRRAQWIASGHANMHCPGCGAPLDPRKADVHHLHYPDVPGTEADEDLVLVCRGCHETVHASLDASPAWRRTSRRDATWAILTALRTRHDTSSTGTRPPSTAEGPSSTTPPTFSPGSSVGIDDPHPTSREDTP